ncbi:Gluconate 2-dehydrogenase subunit 3 [Catalinimonas alkaloidigena]|uniref:Gluconate 2-dehydrogenase subunit 3 n=1 Tax=Catalinimonas alkaloidigena TaxID=1075417 RepID=A0A1G9HG94_9BACT|nr:gluconate 2-dehydrogenase subunit 3 family protein [Catalinimonas alkaloidigena]SDL11917.1 Gluconate 2-dehydrogenase subunit 3 [Catalinimonas alkaloidigena]
MSHKIDRRTSLKYLGAASLAGGLTFIGCDPADKNASTADSTEAMHGHEHAAGDGEMKLSEEDQALMKERFFDDHEMATVTVLANLILPADDRSGNAEEAGVPEFIEFMMKDQPHYQTSMRGGLRWLDVQCMKRFETSFAECTAAQQTEMLDDIAYPEEAKPEMSQGVRFFNQFRDFVATGFFTSKMGIDDLQYIGNRPTVWKGSPPEVLEQLGVSYDMVSEYTFVN